MKKQFRILSGFATAIFLAVVGLIAVPVGYAQPRCTAARAPSYNDLGCWLAPMMSNAKCGSCPTCGMPRWWVSQPYQNVWIADEPLGYPMSHGEHMSFRWAHRQRYEIPVVYNYFHTYTGLTNASGRDATRYATMRTYGATNAAWHQSWLSDILFWDTGWESSWNVGGPTSAMFNGSYEAFWYRADGGLTYLNPPGTNSDPRTKIKLEAMAASGPPLVSFPPVASADTYFWGTQTNGFRIVYPDGGQDIYGLAFFLTGSLSPTNDSSHRSTARAMLTQRIDPQGRITRIGYESAIIGPSQVYRPKFVVDPDGRTNTLSYTNNQLWQVTQIQDPYGRTMRAEYGAAGYGPTKLIDAQGLETTFAYQNGSGWLTNYVTPYGTNSFEYFQEFDSNPPTEYFRRRAVRVTEPDASKQLFLYDHKTDGAGTPTNVVPIPVVAGRTFDDGTTGNPNNDPTIYRRNSFHWTARQYNALTNLVGSSASLSTQLDNFSGNAAAYRLAHLKHWLLGSDLITATEILSLEREASRDAAGSTEGAWTWYSYANSNPSEPELEPTDPLPRCVARVLPDGTTQFQSVDEVSDAGFPTKQRESYTLPNGSVGVRSNWFVYFSSSPDLLVTSNSFGQSLKLTYNSTHQVEFTTNALGDVAQSSYLTSGNPKLSGLSLVGGQTATLTYYSSNSTTANGGFLKTIQWSPGSTWNFGYAGGLPSTATNDMGLRLTFTWDGLLRQTSVGYPDGSFTSNRYDRLDLSASKDRLGNWTYFKYDSMQHLTEVTNANNAVTHYNWCSCGAFEGITDAQNNTTTLSYDNQGNVINVSSPIGSLTYFRDVTGRLTNIVDGLNRSLKFGWNNQGLITSRSNAFGRIDRLVYDGLDRLLESSDANGVSLTNSYDILNRVTNRVWLDGIGERYVWSTNGLVGYTNRNALGTRYWRDPAGRLLGITNANGEVTRASYNSLNQITNLYDGLNHATAFSYNEYGWLTNKADALGHDVFRLSRNANGWVTTRWTPEFGNTTYGYDLVGNLTNVANGAVSNGYAYDGLNQLTNLVDGLGTTKFTYSGGGQLATEDGPWVSDTVSYSYSEGQRTALTFGTWGQSYGYDASGRMTNLTSGAGTFGYSYNSGVSALITRIALPNTGYLTNHYDTLARLDYSGLGNHWGQVLDGYGYTYDANSQRTNIARDYGLTTSSVTAGYDNIGQLTSWSGKEAGGALRWNEQLTYTYDAANNLRTRAQNYFVANQTFNVNAINEVTNVARIGIQTITGYTPSPATNVTVGSNQATNQAERYGDFTFASTNHLTDINNNTFTITAKNKYGVGTTNSWTQDMPLSIALQYDSNGNLTNDGVKTYSYDAWNQLTTNLVVGVWKTEYVYDGLGRKRIQRDYGWTGTWTKTNETRYVYDGMLAVQERDASNNPLVTYTRGLDLSGSLQGAGGIGGLLARTDTSSTTYYHSDGAGNITSLMNVHGDIVARYLYDPFGNLTAKWGSLADQNHYRFSSKEIQPLSGLYYYGFRFYEPNLQRWINQDPIEEEGGMNLYQAFANSPANIADRDGRKSVSNENSYPGSVSYPVTIKPVLSTQIVDGKIEFTTRPTLEVGSAALSEAAYFSPVFNPDPFTVGVVGAIIGALTPIPGDEEAALLLLLRASRCEKAAASAAEGAGATFGKVASTDYRATFLEANPELEGQVIVHHAVEQQVATRYPGVVTEAEMHSLENLRGIPNEVNSDLHLSKIRRDWNQFYRENPTATKEQLLKKATEIDEKYGCQFNPPVGGKKQ